MGKRHLVARPLAILICFLVLAWAACARKGGLARVDASGILEAYPASEVGQAPVTVVTLPQRVLIEKIVVVPRLPLGGFRVEVRTADGAWELARVVTGRHTSAVTIRARLEGDAVRIVEKALSHPTSRGGYVADARGAIETILIYGRPLSNSP